MHLVNVLWLGTVECWHCVDFFTFILVQVLMRRQENEQSVFGSEVMFKALQALGRWIA